MRLGSGNSRVDTAANRAVLESFYVATEPRPVIIPLGDPRQPLVTVRRIALPDCEASAIDSAPCIHDRWIPDGKCSVALPLMTTAPVRIAGNQKALPIIKVVQGPAMLRIVNPVRMEVLALRFDAPWQRKGWPAFARGVQLLEVPSAVWAVTETLARHGLAMEQTWADGAPDTPLHRTMLQRTLFEGLDLCFAAARPLPICTIAARTFERVVASVDAILDEEMAAPVYSEDIAQRVGVSVRTVHTAITAVRGMSLHRYLKLRRLWNARQRIEADPDIPIRDCAMKHGFYHFGQFAASYARQFGELPSQTAALARVGR